MWPNKKKSIEWFVLLEYINGMKATEGKRQQRYSHIKM